MPMPHSAAATLCLRDSNIDAARCGWEIRIGEQWQRDVSLTLNMTRFHVSLRASGASTAINNVG
ncbi:MAG: hypothetical protein K2N20_03280, partial [Helicobacter sp.]|nr:hypothetical protein [Helicobacter sp.]